MVKALLLKELKETAWIWALAAIAYLMFVLGTASVPHVPIFAGSEDEIPFVSPRIAGRLGGITAFLAIGLGIWQSFSETWQGTFPLLLNLPMSRRKLFATKVAVGLGLTWGLAGIALAAVCLWAATPGTHASPFEWSMTAYSWRVWLSTPLLYLGGFATGFYPARWLGPRLLPFVAAFFLVTSLTNVGESPDFPMPVFVASVLLVGGVYIAAIDFLIRKRDFS